MNLRDATRTRTGPRAPVLVRSKWPATRALGLPRVVVASAVALLAAGGGCGGNQAPHGSPALLRVYWQVPGLGQILVWPIDAADGGGARPVPPAALQFNLVFDRVLDGSKIEDMVTIGGVTGPASKATPPVMVSWPGKDDPAVDPPFNLPSFNLAVWYNSVALFGEQAGSAYVYGRETPSYPSATEIKVTLDKTAITSEYNEPMTGPDHFSVTTEPFSLRGVLAPVAGGGDADAGADADVDAGVVGDGGDDGDAGAAVAGVDAGDGGIRDELPHGRRAPVNYWVPLHFNNLPASKALIQPFIHVTSNGQPIDFRLVSDPDDPTLVHLQPPPPAPVPGGDPSPTPAWAQGARIDVSIDTGLPDLFGKPLVTPAIASFIVCSGGCADGGAVIDASADTPSDSPATSDADTDAGDNDAGDDLSSSD